MNTALDLLEPYPFERLAELLKDATPPAELTPIALHIGEPRHAAPAFVLESLWQNRDGYSKYPKTAGEPWLREAIADWLRQRYSLSPAGIDASGEVLPVNGSREALFAFVQATINGGSPRPVVAMPNPFYQIYEGAALLAGAQPLYLPERHDRPGIPDFAAVPESDWARCQLLIICSPGNPCGAVLGLEDWRELFALADHHGFVLASDECYSELYFDEQAPPMGILEACHRLGRTGHRGCIAFHSLSKRSSLPGLRSGFVAGDRALMSAFLRYRTYHGSAMPLPHQHASAAAWRDETHVRENRARYAAKFSAVIEALDGAIDVGMPEGGFYLWAGVAGDERIFARELYIATGVTVLPGRFLSRAGPAGDPGAGRVRIALVGELEECVEAAQRLRGFVRG